MKRNVLIFGAILAAVFAGEFWLFDQVGAHRHTWIYARWNDQVQYLWEAYTGWELVRLHGFFAGLAAAVTRPCAQGTLHPALAILSFSVAGGASRSAALALNMLAMILWQAASAWATWRRTGSCSLAALAAFLPLALAWPWNDFAGSAVDFRLDHLALCGMGTTLACAFRSDGFRSASGSAALGLAAGLTILTRFITAVYLAPLLALLLLLALAGGKERGGRLRRGLGAVLIAGLLALPFLWLDRPYIWSYYGIGHSTGPEAAVRDPHLDFRASAVWLVQGVFRSHLGPAFGWIVLGGTLILAGGVCLWRLPPAADPVGEAAGRARAPRQLAGLGFVFALVPALVLARHKLKSDIVIGISAPGLIALVLAAWFALGRAAGPPARRAAAAGVALACLGFFVARQRAPAYTPEFVVDARKVAGLADTIYRRSLQAGIRSPRVGVDHITDSIDAQAMRLLCYERHHVVVDFYMTLPMGIVEEPAELLMARMQQSDFFFLTAEGGPAGYWPFDHQMHDLNPRARAWCDAHWRAVDHFPLFGRRMVLYQRREIPLD